MFMSSSGRRVVRWRWRWSVGVGEFARVDEDFGVRPYGAAPEAQGEDRAEEGDPGGGVIGESQTLG
jgi:hypothetical protein